MFSSLQQGPGEGLLDRERGGGDATDLLRYVLHLKMLRKVFFERGASKGLLQLDGLSLHCSCEVVDPVLRLPPPRLRLSCRENL